MGCDAADLSYDTGNVLFYYLGCHRRCKILAYEHSARSQFAYLNVLYSQQFLEDAYLDVRDIRRSLAHHLIVHCGEHAVEHVAYSRECGFRALSGVYHAEHFSRHRRILDHDSMAHKYVSFLRPDILSYVFCHRECLFNKVVYGFLKTDFLRGCIRDYFCLKRKILFDNAADAADSDSA